MTELQNELQQTIKRIEQLQRGGGFTAGRNASSGNRRSGFGGSGTRQYGSNRASPYNRDNSKNSNNSTG